MDELGRAVRRFFRSKRSFEMMDCDDYLVGCTWSEGGCAAGASALQQVLPNSEQWAIVYRDQVQHVVVRYRGRFYDADGDADHDTLLSNWAKRESFDPSKLTLIPYTEEVRYEAETHGGLMCPTELVGTLRDELRKVLRRVI